MLGVGGEGFALRKQSSLANHPEGRQWVQKAGGWKQEDEAN
jgi:hypothetical protein